MKTPRPSRQRTRLLDRVLPCCLAVLALTLVALPQPPAGASGSVQADTPSAPAEASAAFSERRNFGSGSDSMYGMVLGDVDGDGDLDIVAGNLRQQSAVYLNGGTSGFREARSFGSDRDSTAAVAVGDVNGDGHLDIVAANLGEPSIIHLNNGSGQFPPTARRPLAAAASSTSVALGDVDSDGDLDVALGNNGQQSRVYLNDGTPTPSFAVSVPFGAAASTTVSLALGDLDDDGDLDIAAGNNGQQSAIYLNDGASPPSFTVSRPVGRAAETATAVALADMNGDTSLDVVLATFGQSGVYLNDGTARFSNRVDFGNGTALTRAMALGDVDADGDIDIVTATLAQQNTVHLNDGAANFGSLSRQIFGATGSDNPGSLALGDMDDDGDLDIALGQVGQQSAVFVNDGGGSLLSIKTFGSGGDSTFSVTTGDVDGNGTTDVVVGNLGQPNAIYLNDSGQLRSGGTFGGGAEATMTVALGDIDRDGDLDIVAGTLQQDAVYLNDGQGGFASGRITCGVTAGVRCFGTGADSTWNIALGDVDRDGDLDIVAANLNTTSLVYLNDGAQPPSFSQVRPIGTALSIAAGLALDDFDDDGDLDIALGNPYGQNLVYLNDGAPLPSFVTGIPFGTGTDATLALASTDIDGDDDQDIVVGNNNQPSAIYLNSGATTPDFADAVPLSTSIYQTLDVATDDVDRDGDSDVVIGNNGQVGTTSFVFLNDGGQVPSFALARPFGSGRENIASLALADMDMNGSLDVVAGANGQQNAVYLSDSKLPPSFTSVQRFGPGGDTINQVAVGDIDGDGDLDLIAARQEGPNAVFLNDGRAGYAVRRAFGSPSDSAASAAVCDLDRDGALDIAVGNLRQPAKVYMNDGTGHFATGVEVGPSAVTRSIACGDVNADGALDLVTGNDGQPNQVFLNNGSGRFDSVRSFGPGADATWSVALGDVDSDGDLDIAVGNYQQPNAVYLNDGSGAFPLSSRFGTLVDRTTSVALGDVDGDGDIDIAVGNQQQQNVIYLNDGTGAFPLATDVGPGNDATYAVMLHDLDSDADLDLVTGNFMQPNAAYVNDGAGAYRTARLLGIDATQTVPDDNSTSGIALGDLDSDGDLDIAAARRERQSVIYLNGQTSSARMPNTLPQLTIARPGATPDADRFSTPLIIDTPTITVAYTLRDRESDPVAAIAVQYSLDGGGAWKPAVAASGTITRSLRTSPQGVSHTFVWDTLASSFFGQSDNVVLRITATVGSQARGAAVGTIQRPAISTQTFPLRMRGTQVRVLQGSRPLSNALVYRVPSGQVRGGQPLADGAGRPFRIDTQGYVQGNSSVRPGDQLVALAPVGTIHGADLYITSAAPNLTGLDAAPVTAPGVQTLIVSPANPLVVLNLDVSLEWDARGDAQYMEQLRFDLRRASELLYGWSSGQVALGAITIYHDRERWDDAHIRIYATNRLRPNANQGGIVTEQVADPDRPTVLYDPGQVRMGAIWNRYGETSGNLGEDWPRTLAHELGHFALFLDDNYLGLDESGRLISVPEDGGAPCPGAMSDPYRDDYGKFHPDAGWLPACAQTLSHIATGRSDWATIKRFYDQGAPGFALRMPANFDAGAGPRALPLELTRINEAPAPPAETLDVPVFSLAHRGSRVQPGASARAFLFRREGQLLVDLGRPMLDQVTARGARPGDRLCVFDLAQQQFGCEAIAAADDQLEIVRLADLGRDEWQPDVRITPATSRTVDLAVAAVPAGLTLQARLFATTGEALPPLTLAHDGARYTGRLTLQQPTVEGYIQLWVDEPGPRREIVTDYALGGNPGLRRARTAPRGSPGLRRARTAPVTSADGQAILFSDGLEIPEGQFYTLHGATTIPGPPPGRSIVGLGYWLQATAAAPDLSDTSINISYLDRETPPGEELGIRVYVLSEEPRVCAEQAVPCWHALPTTLDPTRNEASANAVGRGLYVLMTSAELALTSAGWNLFSYPIRTARPVPVADALRSIDGAYTSVYAYAPDAPSGDSWKIHDSTAPSWVNDLAGLQFGQVYWLYVVRPSTLYLTAPAKQAGGAASPLALPPMTIYGEVSRLADQPVRVGELVIATVGGTECGRGQTRIVDGVLVFVVDVSADNLGTNRGCGAPGRMVTLRIRGSTITLPWDNQRAFGLFQEVTYLSRVTR